MQRKHKNIKKRKGKWRRRGEERKVSSPLSLPFHFLFFFLPVSIFQSLPPSFISFLTPPSSNTQSLLYNKPPTPASPPLFSSSSSFRLHLCLSRETDLLFLPPPSSLPVAWILLSFFHLPSLLPEPLLSPLTL